MAEQETKTSEKLVEIAERETQSLRKGKAIRDEHKKTAEELIKKQEKLNELEKDSVSNKEEIAKLLTSIEISEKKLVDLEEKSVKNQEKLKKLQTERIEAEEKERQEQEKAAKEADDRIDKAEKAEQRIRALKRETNVEISQSSKLMEKMGANAVAFADQASGANKLLSQQTNILAQAEAIMASQKYLTSDFVRELETGKTVSSDIASLEREILSQIDAAANGQYQSVDLSKQRVILEQKLVELKDENSGMTEAERSQAIALVEQQQAALDTLEDQNAQMQKMSEQAAKTLGTFNKFAELDFKGGIRSYFGLDKLKDEMKDKLGKTVLEVTAAVRGEKGLAGAFKAVGSNLKDMSKIAGKMALGLGITGIVAGIGALAKAVMAADEEISNMGKELGVSHHEAGLLHGATQRMAADMNIAGINAHELYEGVKIASDVMGGIDIGAQLANGNKEIEGFVKQAAVLSTQFGLSGEEIGKIKDIATITGKPMDQLVKESKELGTGTMTAKQTLKALSSIPPVVAAGFKGSTKELIAAAQKAKMLGMELGKVQDIGMGMLEIEDSLGKEMEARVLTGKNINLDAARAAALNGDVVTLQEELLKQAGSLEEFTGMNTLAQESMAKAMGMQREEMVKMLTNAEKLKNAGIDSDMSERLANMETAAQLEEAAANATSEQQRDYILQLANEKRSASLKEKMADMLAKIKARLAPIVEKIVEMAHGFFDGAKGASKFDSILASIDVEKIVKTVQEMLPKIIDAVKGLIENLPKIIAFISGMVDKFSSFVGFLGPTNSALALMAFKFVGPKGIAEGIGLAAKGAKSLLGIGTKAAEAAGGAAAEAAAGAAGGKRKKPKMPRGKSGGGFMDKLTDSFKKMDMKELIKGALAMLILAAAMWVLAKALQEFASVEWESIAKGLVAILALVGIAYLLSKVKGEMIEGALAMVILGGALWVIGYALQMFTKIGWEDLAKAGVALVGLSLIVAGLGFLIIPIGLGVLALAILSAGILAFSASVAVLAVAAALASKSMAAILLTVDKLIAMDSEKLSAAAASLLKIGSAIAILALVGPAVLLASVALVALSVSLLLMSVIGPIAEKSLAGIFEQIKKMSEMDSSKLAATALSIIAFGGSLALLGLLAPVIAMAALSFVLFAGALSILAAVGPVAEKSLAGTFEQINKLTTLDPGKLLAASGAILTVGAAMLGFSAMMAGSKIASGLGNVLGGLLGGASPMEQVMEIANKLDGKKLSETAKAIRDLADAFKYFAEETSKLKEFDTDKLEQIIEKMEEVREAEAGGKMATAVTGVANAVTGFIGNLFGSPEKQSTQTVSAGGGGGTAAGGGGGGSLANVEKKLDTLISVISQAANQPTVIKFGEKTVEEMKSQLNFKKAYNIGIDKGYGKTI